MEILQENSESEIGFSTFVNIQKINGHIQYKLQNYIESDNYNINDMGFLYQNNEINNSANLSYNIFSSDERIAQKINIAQ